MTQQRNQQVGVCTCRYSKDGSQKSWENPLIVYENNESRIYDSPHHTTQEQNS